MARTPWGTSTIHGMKWWQCYATCTSSSHPICNRNMYVQTYFRQWKHVLDSAESLMTIASWPSQLFFYRCWSFCMYIPVINLLQFSSLSSLIRVFDFTPTVDSLHADSLQWPRFGILTPYHNGPQASGVRADLPSDCKVNQVMMVSITAIPFSVT